MDLKLCLFLLADAAMVASAFVYGWKFHRRRNYLLWLEWWIVGISGTNFFVYGLSGLPFLWSISYFLDAFSRAFGFPLIALAGQMALTHRYKPSVVADIALFAVSAAGAVVLVAVDAVAPFKPGFYLLMWSAYSLYNLYFAWRLLRAGERAQALGLLAVTAAAQAIATIYDFFHIPGDDEQHTLFYIAALSTWAYSLMQTYYAYCALERAENP